VPHAFFDLLGVPPSTYCRRKLNANETDPTCHRVASFAGQCLLRRIFSCMLISVCPYKFGWIENFNFWSCVSASHSLHDLQQSAHGPVLLFCAPVSERMTASGSSQELEASGQPLKEASGHPFCSTSTAIPKEGMLGAFGSKTF